MVEKTQTLPVLKYAYQAEFPEGKATLLGSLIRALGKGWRVGVLAGQSTQLLLEQIEALLNKPTLLTLLNEKELGKESKAVDLILNLIDESTLIKEIATVFSSVHLMTVDKKPDFESYDLISNFKTSQLNQTGVVAITGTGKGKTTTALGLALPALAEGEKVAVIQWFKEKKAGHLTWAINEHHFPEQLKDPNSFIFHATGAGFVGSPKMDRVAEQAEHVAKAHHGLELARKLIRSQEYEVVILDEFVDTLPQVMVYLPYPLLELEEVQQTLQLAQESNVKVIVTGRRVTAEWQEYIKTSIVITEVKHPWSSRQAGAISGLDY